MPVVFKYIVGIICAFGFSGAFLYYTYISYTSGRNNSFISLSNSAGDCVEVGRLTSGAFLVGVTEPASNLTKPSYVWSTSSEFALNKAGYSMVLDQYTSKQAMNCVLYRVC